MSDYNTLPQAVHMLHMIPTLCAKDQEFIGAFSDFSLAVDEARKILTKGRQEFEYYKITTTLVDTPYNDLEAIFDKSYQMIANSNPRFYPIPQDGQ